MKFTENYNLKKPDYTDIADIPEHFNGNIDTIDTQLKKNADDLVAHKEDFASYKRQGFVTRLVRATNLTGDQYIELGFRPKLVYVVAKLEKGSNINYESYGARSLPTNTNISRLATGNIQTGYTDRLIMLHSGGAYNEAYSTITDTGITLLWRKLGDIAEDNIIILLFAI